MKKIIMMLSVLTIIPSITPLITACDKNKLNEIETKPNDTENLKFFALNTWFDHWIYDDLKDDCKKNFGKHYRLKAERFKHLTWKDIIRKFEAFLYEKYDIKFKIGIKKDDSSIDWLDKKREDDGENDFLTNGLNIKEIYVSLFKIEEEWKILNSDLKLRIILNDVFAKLNRLKYEFEVGNSWFQRYEEKKVNFNNVNELVVYLNEYLSKTKNDQI